MAGDETNRGPYHRPEDAIEVIRARLDHQPHDGLIVVFIPSEGDGMPVGLFGSVTDGQEAIASIMLSRMAVGEVAITDR
jgi:hypothetical protein